MMIRSNIVRNIVLPVLAGALLVGLIILSVNLSIKNHQLEKAKQHLVDDRKEEISRMKNAHRASIRELKMLQIEQDKIIKSQRAEKRELMQEYKSLQRKIMQQNERIDQMDSTALLDELKRIRAAHQIY
jgi:hypothetical protein